MIQAVRFWNGLPTGAKHLASFQDGSQVHEQVCIIWLSMLIEKKWIWYPRRTLLILGLKCQVFYVWWVSYACAHICMQRWLGKAKHCQKNHHALLQGLIAPCRNIWNVVRAGENKKMSSLVHILLYLLLMMLFFWFCFISPISRKQHNTRPKLHTQYLISRPVLFHSISFYFSVTNLTTSSSLFPQLFGQICLPARLSILFSVVDLKTRCAAGCHPLYAGKLRHNLHSRPVAKLII